VKKTEGITEARSDKTSICGEKARKGMGYEEEEEEDTSKNRLK